MKILKVKVICFISIIGLMFNISVSIANEDRDFDFSDPEESYSSIPNILFTNTTGKEEKLVFFLPGGILKQRTNSTNGLAYYQWRNTNKDKTIHPELDLLIKAKFKIQDITGLGASILACDGIYRYLVTISKNEIGEYCIEIDGLNMGEIIKLYNTSKYLSLSIISYKNSNKFELLLDSNLVYSGQAPNCYPEDVNGLIWGDIWDKEYNGADIDWDYIRIYQGAKTYSQYDVDKIISNILMWGDLNNDGKIGIYEAIRSLQVITSPVSK